MDAPYYDREADVAYFPVGESDDVVTEVVYGFGIDRDARTGATVGIEIPNANLRLPSRVLQALPQPPRPDPE